jgi:hypothetical protein
MMSAERNPLDALSLLAGWIVANAAGWGVGLALGTLLTIAGRRIPGLNEDRFFTYAILVVLGLATGAAQWVMMRRYLPQSARWVPASVAGYALCALIVAGANWAQLAGAGPWDDALMVGLMGAAIGLCQWWILRRSYRQAWLWVVATAAGSLGLFWLTQNPSHNWSVFIIRSTVVGALSAVVPGIALIRLVRRPLRA